MNKILIFTLLLGLSNAYAAKGTFKLKDHIDFKFGGRLMLDGALYDDDNEDLQSGTKVRRARLYWAGKVLNDFDFIIQTDFAGNGVSIKAAHIGYSWDKSKITLGNQLPSYSLQLQTSSKWQTMVSRAAPVLAFNPDNSFGLSYKTSTDSCFFKTGIYGGTAAENTARERFIFGARTSCAPMLGSALNHIGFSYLHTEREDGISFKSNNETNIDGTSFITTESVNASSTDRIALEYAMVKDSFSFQAEFLANVVKANDRKDATLKGWYAFVSWFPTGDSRNYSKSSAAFGEIKPNKQYGSGGIGAVETALRISNMDFTGNLKGGKQSIVGAELNWYPGGGLKFMLNHSLVNSEKDNVKDKPSMTQFRAQMTW